MKFFVAMLFLSVGTVSAKDLQLNRPYTPEGKQALIKMTHGMETLNYQGTVAFLRNGKLEPMKYSHAAKNGREQERLLSLNSPLREVTRDKDKISCLFKATQQLVVDHRPFERSFLINIPKQLDELESVYSFEIVGEENVAMLPAYVIAIKPKDNFRFARKIWLEKQNFLPLKVVVYDRSDEILEQLVFTELQVKNELPFVNVNAPDNALARFKSQSGDQPNFVVSSVPQGFREIFFTSRPIHNSSQPVDHLLLSDGLASISIYMEHKNTSIKTDHNVSQSIQSVGAVNFISRSIGNFEIVVMGEVPAETVKLIADSVKLK
ncbi:MAG: MucB/RseB C-terminal domain-containing protein [Methylococcaceae bacterium]